MLPTSIYPMWYNVIPPFVPLNPSCIQLIKLEQKDFIHQSLGIIHVMYLGMCTQYMNNLLYHQHIYQTLLEIDFL
jgi:hypothetical protein